MLTTASYLFEQSELPEGAQSISPAVLLSAMQAFDQLPVSHSALSAMAQLRALFVHHILPAASGQTIGAVGTKLLATMEKASTAGIEIVHLSKAHASSSSTASQVIAMQYAGCIRGMLEHVNWLYTAVMAITATVNDQTKQGQPLAHCMEHSVSMLTALLHRGVEG